MTRIRDAALFLVLAASTVIAFAQAPERPTPPTPQPGQTQQMQSRMQSMHETMERIHATQDPAERQRLMQEHMQAMHEGMVMMGQMMGGPTGGPGGNAASRCGEGDAACQMDRMQMEQGAMTERMGMMQQMMQQMMDHMMQREAAPTPSPETQQPPATEQNHAEHH